jgi:hypothetical protein
MVVGVDVEGDERLAHLGGSTFEEGVEELLPGLGMQARRPGQDAVEIEENRVVVAQESVTMTPVSLRGVEPFRAWLIKDLLAAERGATWRDGPG